MPPKKNIFRDYKKFDEQNVLYDLDQQMIKGKFYEEKNVYESFSDTFKAIVNKHVPPEGENCKRKKAPFMTRDLKKATMNGLDWKESIKIGPLEKTLKTGKHRKMNVISFVEKLKRTILRISQKTISIVTKSFSSL